MLGPPFLDQRLASLDRIREFTNVEKAPTKKQERVENWDAAVTAWPAWVYRQYDPKRLSYKIRQFLQFLEISELQLEAISIRLTFIVICNLYLCFTGGGSIPKDPVELSFWVAQNILLDHNERLALLSYDCAISRLQRELKYLMNVRMNCYFIYKNLTSSDIRIKERKRTSRKSNGKGRNSRVVRRKEKSERKDKVKALMESIVRKQMWEWKDKESSRFRINK